MNPVIGSGNGIQNLPPAHLVEDVYDIEQAEIVNLADSIEVREDPEAHPLIKIAGLLCETVEVILLLLVVIPIFILGIPAYLLGTICKSGYEYLKDSFEEFTRWLWPEETIPEELHGDEVFSRNICPLTYAPIRFPVYDRRHPEHIYERSAILRWLNQNPTSPITRQPTTPDDLIPHAALQAQIEERLRELNSQGAL